MPVADDRIDMCRTGPPCNATAGKAGNETMDTPCPARRPDRCPEPCVSGQEDRRGGPVQSAVLCRDGPPGGKRGAV